MCAERWALQLYRTSYPNSNKNKIYIFFQAEMTNFVIPCQYLKRWGTGARLKVLFLENKQCSVSFIIGVLMIPSIKNHLTKSLRIKQHILTTRTINTMQQ